MTRCVWCEKEASGEIRFRVMRIVPGEKVDLADELMSRLEQASFPACTDHAQGIPVHADLSPEVVDNPYLLWTTVQNQES